MGTNFSGANINTCVSRVKQARALVYLAAVAFSAFLVMLIFPFVNVTTNADDDTSEIYETPTLSVTSSSVEVEATPSATGTFFSASTNVSVATNNYTGYTLTMTGDEQDFNKLKLADTEAYLPSISEEITEQAFTEDDEFNGKWGYKITGNGNYRPAVKDALLDRTTTKNEAGKSYSIALGARVDYSTGSGSYTNNYILSAVANQAGYNIIYESAGDVSNLPPNEESTTPNNKINISATTPSRGGYEFLGWCSGNITTTNTVDACNTTVYQPNGTYDIDQLSSNVLRLKAMWAQKHTVTVQAGNGVSSLTTSNGATLSGTYVYGTQINLANYTPSYKTGYSGINYTNTGAGSVSGSTFTVGAGNGTVSVNANTLATPTCSIKGGVTKVYNSGDDSTTLTATAPTSTQYDLNSVNVAYSFGYATSATNALGNFGSNQANNYIDISKTAFRGIRYYGVKVTVSDKNDSSISSTCTSGTGTSTGATAGNRTTMGIVNSRIDLVDNSGTLTGGNNPFYVSYDQKNIYTGRTNDAAATLPTASKTGYDFIGWYDSNDYKVIDASGAISANIPSWTNISGNWTKAGTSANKTDYNTLNARYSAKNYSITLNKNGATNTPTASTTATYNSATLAKLTTLPTKNSSTTTRTVSGFTRTASASDAIISSTTQLSSTSTTSYTFNGWYKEAGATNKIADSNITPNLIANTDYTDADGKWTHDGVATFYAGWTTNASNFTAVDLPTITKEGYSCWWYTNENGTNGTRYESGATGVVPSDNLTLFGFCSAEEYTVTVHAGNGIDALTASGWTGTGTATLTKEYNYGDTINLANFTKSYAAGYSGAKYTNNAAGSISSGTFTVGAGDGDITINASSLANPTCSVSGGALMVYNYGSGTGDGSTTITATAPTSGTYADTVEVKYRFAYSTTASADFGSWGSYQNGNTTTIGKTAFRGIRYYGVNILVRDKNDNTISGACTSGTGTGTGATVANRTTVALTNTSVNFNAGTGATLDGASRVFVPYQSSVAYNSTTGSTSAAEVSLPTASKTGYTFNGWYTASTGGNKVVNSDGTLVTAAVTDWVDSSQRWAVTTYANNTVSNTLYAQFTPNTYNVALNSNGATTAGTATAKATYNSTTLTSTTDGNITNPSRVYTFTLNSRSDVNIDYSAASSNCTSASCKSTYTFNGWYQEAAATNKIASNAVKPALQASTAYTDANKKWTDQTGNVTLYAGWTAQSVTLPTVTKANYTCGWTGDHNADDNETSIAYKSGSTISAPIQDMNLYVVCHSNIYSLGLITNNSFVNDAGTLTIYERYGEGYYLDQYGEFEVSGKMTTTNNGVTIPTASRKVQYNRRNASGEYQANGPFPKDEYNFTFNGYFTAATGGTKYISEAGFITSSASNTYFDHSADALYAQWNDTATLPNITRTGYTVESWCTSIAYTTCVGDPGSTYHVSAWGNQTGDLSLYPKFVANTYKIQYDAGDGTGTMSDTDCTYDSNCTLRTNTFTRTGYNFVGWKNGSNTYTDGQTVSNLTSTNNGTVTLTAQWEIKSNLSLKVSFDSHVSNIKVCKTSGNCTGANLISTVTTSGSLISGLTYGSSYYLYPSYYTGYQRDYWGVGGVGQVSSTSADNPYYIMGDGNNSVELHSKAKTNLSISVTFDSNVSNVKVCKVPGDCTDTNLLGTISTSGNSVSGLSFMADYYLYPTYKTGYEFSEWANTGVGDLSSTSAANPYYTTDDGANSVSLTSKIKTNLSLTVSFDAAVDEIKVCKVSGNCTGSNIVATVSHSGDQVENLTYNTRYFLYPTFESGYQLKNWAKADGAVGTLSSVSAANPYYTIGDGTNSVELISKKETYTASFNLNGGTGSAWESKTVTLTYGDEMPSLSDMTAPTRDGYIFSGWYFANTAYYDDMNAGLGNWDRDACNDGGYCASTIFYAGWVKLTLTSISMPQNGYQYGSVYVAKYGVYSSANMGDLKAIKTLGSQAAPQPNETWRACSSGSTCSVDTILYRPDMNGYRTYNVEVKLNSRTNSDGRVLTNHIAVTPKRLYIWQLYNSIRSDDVLKGLSGTAGTPSESDIDWWTGALTTSTMYGRVMASIVRHFYHTTEAESTLNTNTKIVLALYKGILGQTKNSTDTDVVFWVGELDNGDRTFGNPGDPDDIVKAFVNSPSGQEAQTLYTNWGLGAGNDTGTVNQY